MDIWARVWPSATPELERCPRESRGGGCLEGGKRDALDRGGGWRGLRTHAGGAGEGRQATRAGRHTASGERALLACSKQEGGGNLRGEGQAAIGWRCRLWRSETHRKASWSLAQAHSSSLARGGVGCSLLLFVVPHHPDPHPPSAPPTQTATTTGWTSSGALLGGCWKPWRLGAVRGAGVRCACVVQGSVCGCAVRRERSAVQRGYRGSTAPRAVRRRVGVELVVAARRSGEAPLPS